MRSDRMRFEQWLVIAKIDVADRRNAGHELDMVVLEPAQHLVHGMLALVRVLVLVAEPGGPAAGIERIAAQPAAERSHAVTEHLNQTALPQGRQPAEPIVQADDDVAARLELGEDRAETAFR